MKLLVDIGNTRIKWVRVHDDKWPQNGVTNLKSAAELTSQVSEWPEIDEIWVSNVAGNVIERQIMDLGVKHTHIISPQKLQCGVSNGYSEFAQLGSDRWASLIAAWNMLRSKCLVVTSGTATTIDALSERGEFIGGLILPGIELMQSSLAAATDQLEAVRGQYVPFPLNTADAMFSGALQACCGAVERQSRLLGNDVPIIISGGSADVLEHYLGKAAQKPYFGESAQKIDNLVLRGLLLISKEMEVVNK
ncbi:MAG: type III pantothenate kinase [Gallionella sp.]